MPTGGFTGTGAGTGSTGSGTGTGSGGKSGSSWSHPSHWANQPGQQLGPGSVIKERFVLEEIIGRGGMGIVFKARDQRKEEAQDRNPHVAIKVLNEEFKRHPESLKALQRESRKAQKLAHPNVVTVFDFDRDGANVFMVMELLEGEPLDRVIKASDGTGIGVKESLAIARALCAALAYAHEQGVVHSDFKPANAYRTISGVIKVFDFGIARAARNLGDARGETTLFDAGTLGALTPAYASCEMIEGLEPDVRDDIYAVACVVYELMTGRHPFNKMSAVQARDGKQTPKRVPGISGRQWKGLLRGLAFDRNQRTPSVEQFIYDISPQRRSQPLYLGAAAGIVAIVISAAMFLPGYLEKRRIRGLIEAVTAGDPAVIEDTLPRIVELEPDQRAGVILAVRQSLIDYVNRRVAEVFDPARNRFDFQAAQAIVARLQALDPDSRSFAEIAENLRSRRDEAISDQSDRFDEYLRNGWLLPAQNARNVQGVLAIMRQLDPTHALLKDPRLALAYGEQSRKALEVRNAQLAQALIAEGLQLAPDDPRLRDLRDEAQRQSGAQQRQARVAELRNSIEDNLGATPTLAGIDERRAELEELKSLAPDDPSLRRAQLSLQRTLDREITALARQRSFQAAQALLARYAGLAQASYVDTKRSDLARADTDYRERVAALTDALAAAIRDGRLEAPAQNNALSILAQLQSAGVDEARLSAARDQIAHGYVSRAGVARSAGRWNDARLLVDRGIALQPTQSVIDVLRSEQQEIDHAERVAKSTADAEQRQQLLAQRQAEDRKLLAQLAEGLEAPRLNVENARRLLQLADNLGRRGVKDAQVTNARRDIQARLIAEIGAVRDANRLEEAIRLAESANGLMPSSPALQKSLAELRALGAQRLNQQRDQAIAQIKGRIDTLTRAGRLDDKWEADIAGEFDRLSAYVPATDPYVVAAKQRAANALVSQARQLRAQSRLNEAERMLRRSERYSPDPAMLASERQLLAQDRARQEAAGVEQKRAAEVAALKQKLLTRAQAEEISEAFDLLNELKKVLPANDSFVTREGPTAIVNAYLNLVTKATRRGEFTAAVNLLARAREVVPARTDLVAIHGRYQRLEQIDRSLKSAAAVDTAQVRQQLAAIRKADADGYKAIEQGLAENMARRITQVRSRDAALAEQLSRSARDLFADTDAVRRLPAASAAAPATPPAQVASTPRQQPPPAASTAETPAASQPSVGGTTTPVSSAETQVARVETPTPRATGGSICRANLAGFGRRGTRGICFDVTPGGRGPEMVVIPAGGAIAEPFAISRYEITIGDFTNYCQQSGQCNPGGGQADLPITAISVANAERYAAWLSQITGAQYRLPTDAEWTHAATAQGASGERDFNCVVELGGSRVKGGALLSVRSGAPNDWGLYNYVGNVQELVRSGSGWVVRGGTYNDSIAQCTVSLSRPTDGAADPVTGFRLVRNVSGAG